MKRVLITGGSGSFGNAFVRKLLETDPERVVVYSRDEQKQDAMDRQFSMHRSYNSLRFFIGDVRDCDRLEFAMHGVDTIIHAAALKIVPTAEYNPTECIATNVYGAENVVRAAIRAGVKRVIALSTDKAVNPVNLYGASKLAAEKIFVAANFLAAGSTLFSVVRYGNVVGSRGSVIPLFKKLAAEGKSLPVTDTRMTRFWITLEQAVDFVLYAHEHMSGREIFIPKIPSMKISDLALAFDDSFHIVGIRPGEKLHECLLTEDESREAYDLGDSYIILPSKSLYKIQDHWVSSFVGLPDGFRYTSDTNTDWLTTEQLKGMI